ncbi:MAG: UvrD-helicase domain-containing protein [Alphaproteobacteria bacterium]|nr:UvrD-helicase domain-containing protein [Alphaproteobacteria bacterium]
MQITENILRKDTDIDKELQSLNAEQYDAVVTLDRPLLVLSGAGTGKTKVLTTKIAYIIENGFAFPSQILAVTFSNRAAREMKERLFGITSSAMGVWLGTFHSICAKILRSHAEAVGISRDFTILDADDQLKVVKQILKEMNIDAKAAPGIVAKISRWKDKGISPDNPSVDKTTQEGRVYKVYQERIVSYDSVDFGDLLLYVVQIFKENPDILQTYRNRFKYILVDEYQDTNVAQYLWLRMLSPLGQGLCCVGDDDQAIYSWRGAEVGNILRFEKDFPNTKTVRLEQNYRSTGHILGAAASLISNNQMRLGKTIWTADGDGDKVIVQRVYNGYEEAQVVSEKIEQLHRKYDLDYKNAAVLVRAGFQTREFEERFIANGIPYKVVGGLKFYDRQEIKDIVAYMRLIYQPNDSLAFERIVNVPKRGIGASAVAKFYTVASEKNISLYLAAKDILEHETLRPSLKHSLDEFIKFIESMRLRHDLKSADIARIILDETGYAEALKQEKTLESQARLENLKELLQALEEFEDLPSFIEHISLVMDSPKTEEDNVVSIMTLHSAKGLEFDAVFLGGWEDGVFPHNLSIQEGNVEEERRLAYVGITRARKLTFITYALNRKIHNQWQANMPSRFLSELSPEHITHITGRSGCFS